MLKHEIQYKSYFFNHLNMSFFNSCFLKLLSNIAFRNKIKDNFITEWRKVMRRSARKFVCLPGTFLSINQFFDFKKTNTFYINIKLYFIVLLIIMKINTIVWHFVNVFLENY